MTKKEMVRNVWRLSIEERAIPVYRFHYKMTIGDLRAHVRNALFNRFVAEVVTDSELCGVSPLESGKFAVDFVRNNNYVKKCLTATIDLVLNGSFSKKWELDGFIDKLLWTHVCKACNKPVSLDAI